MPRHAYLLLLIWTSLTSTTLWAKIVSDTFSHNFSVFSMYSIGENLKLHLKNFLLWLKSFHITAENVPIHLPRNLNSPFKSVFKWTKGVIRLLFVCVLNYIYLFWKPSWYIHIVPSHKHGFYQLVRRHLYKNAQIFQCGLNSTAEVDTDGRFYQDFSNSFIHKILISKGNTKTPCPLKRDV